MGLLVDHATLTPASAADAATGLLAYVSITLNSSLKIDGITLRSTARGRTVLSWPERRSRCGRRHPIVAPTSEAAREAVESQVFAALVPMMRACRDATPETSA